MRPYGQKRVGYGDDTKMGRAKERERWLQALRECTCVHGVSIVEKCAACDTAFDADERATDDRSPATEEKR